jgi:tetratricopeptide (TPR) repeat protein
MSSSSVGDTADVAFFLPKALIIHEQLNPTDPDGLYHYALLYQVGGDAEAALAKAEQGLSESPDYLLLLAVAAEAQASLGNDAAARELYARFLEVYDAELAIMRPGYEHHQTILPVYREEARVFLNRD